jgi:hypothetical protein
MTEPGLNQPRRFPDANAFLAADEVQNTASGLAIAEAMPTVLGNTDSELGMIMPMMQGARASEAIANLAQLLSNAVLVQDLNHRHRLFYGRKVRTCDPIENHFRLLWPKQKRGAEALPLVGIMVNDGNV